MQKFTVTLTFLEPILGTAPKDPEIYKTYIASKAAEMNGIQYVEIGADREVPADELATVQDVEEKGWTGFHLLNGCPILYDYAIKGFFKDACSMLRRVEKSNSSKITAHKKIIDGLIFVEPRQLPLTIPAGQTLGVLERPLRAQTAQGERVTLARSDTAPAGTTITFDVIVMGVVNKAQIVEWLDYGRFRGLGQWRNGGYGKFEYTISEAI